jgi:hypothetical protein
MSDNIERLLRHDARIELPDDGFAIRVVGALPAKMPKARPWLRPVLVMGSALVGSALAVTLSPQAASLVQGFQDLMYLRTSSAGAIGGLAMCGALLLSGLVLAIEG